MSLCLSIWSSDAWDSSEHRVRHQSAPTLRGVMRHQIAPVVGSLFSFLSIPRGYRHGGMSKAATCHVSFNTQLSPVMTHCLAWMLLRLRTVFAPQRPFSWFWELEVSCFCLHGCQTDWTHTHDEFTPLWGYLCVCVWFLLRSVRPTQSALRLKSIIFNTELLYQQKHIFALENTFRCNGCIANWANVSLLICDPFGGKSKSSRQIWPFALHFTKITEYTSKTYVNNVTLNYQITFNCIFHNSCMNAASYL